MSGHLDELQPAELAAVFEAISTEVNRPDIWSGYRLPPKAEEALNQGITTPAPSEEPAPKPKAKPKAKAKAPKKKAAKKRK